MHFNTIQTSNKKIWITSCKITHLTGSYEACSCMTWFRVDHRIGSLQMNQFILCIGLTYMEVGWTKEKTHWIMNFNVAERYIYLHGLINSASHTLP